MKTLLIVFGIFLSTNFCMGQDSIPKVSKWKSNNIIKTNLVGYIKSMAIFSYERVLTKNVSIMATYGQGKYKVTGPKAENNLENTIGRTFPCTQEITLDAYFSIESRYYISFKQYKIPAGFHIGPSINYTKGSEVFTSTGNVSGSFGTHYGKETVTTEYSNTAFLVNIGPQLLIKRVVAIDLSIGVGYGKTKGTQTDVYGLAQQYGSTSDFAFSSVALTFSASVGIAFGR